MSTGVLGSGHKAEHHPTAFESTHGIAVELASIGRSSGKLFRIDDTNFVSLQQVGETTERSDLSRKAESSGCTSRHYAPNFTNKLMPEYPFVLDKQRLR